MPELESGRDRRNFVREENPDSMRSVNHYRCSPVADGIQICVKLKNNQI